MWPMNWHVPVNMLSNLDSSRSIILEHNMSTRGEKMVSLCKREGEPEITDECLTYVGMKKDSSEMIVSQWYMSLM